MLSFLDMQAKKTPDALAVDDPCAGVRLTFRELDEVTDRLAAVLFHKHGVRPDSVVGIFMERSAEYVIANVAALKAGGAYMPLELVYPKGLLSRAIMQTKCQVVLSKSKHAARLPEEDNFAVILIDSPTSVPAGASLPADVYPVPATGFSPRPNPDNLAFVVMSSGTTGQPKGICQVHRSAVHSYYDRLERYPYHVNPDTGLFEDRIGAGVFFIWELFRPLLRGATCVVVPDEVPPPHTHTHTHTHASNFCLHIGIPII